MVKADFARLYDLILQEPRASYLSTISQINGLKKALTVGQKKLIRYFFTIFNTLFRGYPDRGYPDQNEQTCQVTGASKLCFPYHRNSDLEKTR